QAAECGKLAKALRQFRRTSRYRQRFPMEASAGNVFSGIAAHPKKRIVGIREPSTGLEEQDANRLDFEGPAEPFLGYAHQFSGSLAFGHVHEGENSSLDAIVA